MNLPTQTIIEDMRQKFDLLPHQVSPARDALVMCPDPKWVEEFSSWIAKQSHPIYTLAAWDCDDFAFWCSVEASRCRAGALGTTGHAVFIAYISVDAPLNGLSFDKGAEHACMLIRTNDGNWLFFEPQTGDYCNAENAMADGRAYVDYVIV